MNDRLIIDYKNLHQIPEEGFKEFKTQRYILEQLKDLKCEVFELSPTGILAFFDYGKCDTIAFRCEMDGLKIYEENDFEYKSVHDGYMHACGHDGHMAILLSLAYKLSTIKCPKNICLIFQPSEECYGGALQVINTSEYQLLNIKEVFGLHLWPGLKKGSIASKRRTMMANATEIDITINGKSAHIAKKDEGVDAILVAYDILDRMKDEEGVIFHCGKISSFGARNVVCSKVNLECTLRSLYKIRRKIFLDKLTLLAKEISNEKNINIFINSNKYIPEVKNDLILFEKYRHLIDEVISPVYQAEDFSFYGNNSKTLFMFLGVGETSSLHSNTFSFDVDILEKGLKILFTIATSY